MPRTRQFNVMNGRFILLFTRAVYRHAAVAFSSRRRAVSRELLPEAGSPRLCNPRPEVRNPNPSVLWYAGGAQRPFPP
eukprot:1971795-Alexandrium_andersonii.AAC.1